MKLLLIRHAAAVPGGTPGVPDGERQLTADGEAEFRSAAGGLAWIVDPPDVLLSSPLARARATAGIAARTFGRLEPRIEPALAHGTLETILAALASHGSTATMALVGHEPLLSALLAWLLGVSDSDRLGFEKGGPALVDLPDGLASAGRLVWFLDPRILRTLAGRRESATEERIRARRVPATACLCRSAWNAIGRWGARHAVPRRDRRNAPGCAPLRLAPRLRRPRPAHRRGRDGGGARRHGLVARIRRETDHARAGRPARIIARMNGLVDHRLIEELYAVSDAGRALRSQQRLYEITAAGGGSA